MFLFPLFFCAFSKSRHSVGYISLVMWLGIDRKECVKKVPGGVSFKYGFIYDIRIIFRKFSAARYFSRLEYFACFLVVGIFASFGLAFSSNASIRSYVWACVYC